MKIKELTTNQLKELRIYLLVERMHVRSAETWQKCADISDKVSKELQSRAVRG